MSEESVRLNRITEDIIGAAIDVHRALGPGLLESAYEACEAFELGNHPESPRVLRPAKGVLPLSTLRTRRFIKVFSAIPALSAVSTKEHLLWE